METKELEMIISSAELRNPNVYNASRERYVAEISFKAGYKQRELDPFDKEDRCDKCYQQGIREVVEWINYYLELPEVKGSHSIEKIIKPQWQAKLKEWGL